jgi:hypothetical protein
MVAPQQTDTIEQAAWHGRGIFPVPEGNLSDFNDRNNKTFGDRVIMTMTYIRVGCKETWLPDMVSLSHLFSLITSQP